MTRYSFVPARPDYPVASVAYFSSAALTKIGWVENERGCALGKRPGSGISLAAIGVRHRLHGDDRQSAIWLDAIRIADRREISLGARRHSGRLQHFRPDRDLAGAGRGLVRGPVRSEDRRADWWYSRWSSVGAEFDRGIADHALYHRGD